jgi:hypothetical protein
VICAAACVASGVFGFLSWKAASDRPAAETQDPLDQKTIDSINTIADKLSEFVSEDVLQEDDVVIGGEYVIRSTLAISDAYISGDRSALSDRDKETLDMASSVLDEIIEDTMTPFEKEKAVYAWMTKNLQFDGGSLLVIPQTGEDCDNPYGVLKYHNAVCVGYATTFRLFMQMMGIECKVVHNTSRSHSWDLVNLDGSWYHTDIYSDVGSGNYTSFNMNDSACARGHEWNREFFPAANGYEYSMAYIERVKKDDIWNIPAAVREKLDEGSSVLGVEFSEQIDESKAQIVEQMMEDVSYRLSSSADYSDVDVTWSWIDAGDNYVFCCYLSRYGEEDEPDPDISLDDLARIDYKVEEAFGDLEEGEWSDYPDHYDGYAITGEYEGTGSVEAAP